MKRALILMLALGACGGTVGETDTPEPMSGGPDARLAAPDRATFVPVDNVLQASCGTLDCHGQVGRSLRLYGSRGLRWSKTGNPADDATTPEEYDHSYWSVIGLEPEVMSDVVKDHGRNPERLTMVRKARELEHHKGSKVFTAGDDRDRCLTSWLAGALDADACMRGKELMRPMPQP
jgi:hypothetical protein